MFNRNTLVAMIAILAIAVTFLGYQYYQERQNTSRVEIQIGEDGISIEKN